MIDKYHLANYIVKEYFDAKGCEISPVKLHKTIYLIYGMWAGNVRMIINSSQPQGEYDISLTEKLFNSKFEAWNLGPVEVDIHKYFKDKLYTDECVLPSVIKDFVDAITKQTFDMSDFSLINTTQKDSVFKKCVNTKDRTMCNHEIIEEYYQRLSNRQ